MDPDHYDDIAEEHAESAAFLWHLRSLATRQPHYLLDDLNMLDGRMAAHADGLRVAGNAGWSACRRLLANDDAWTVGPFALMVLEAGDRTSLERLFALAEAKAEFQPMLESALGWVSPQFLRGTVHVMLQSPSPQRRHIGIACCAMHRTDPGPTLVPAMKDADPALRARALRASGELGRLDLLEPCLRAVVDDEPACRYWAATAALLLGDRDEAVNALTSLAMSDNAWQERALRRVLKVMDSTDSRALLAKLVQQPTAMREVIQGVGHTGQMSYGPWLIERMRNLATARLAGEAFTLITGADLAGLELDRPPPDDVEFGPSDDPDDDNVAMDEDEGLPWPDADKVAHWWSANESRFAPGTRYFMGQTVTPAHCLQVLRQGYQRQRIAAAQHLCLLAPGSVLFPVSAPAWRQQRLLAKMT